MEGPSWKGLPVISYISAGWSNDKTIMIQWWSSNVNPMQMIQWYNDYDQMIITQCRSNTNNQMMTQCYDNAINKHLAAPEFISLTSTWFFQMALLKLKNLIFSSQGVLSRWIQVCCEAGPHHYQNHCDHDFYQKISWYYNILHKCIHTKQGFCVNIFFCLCSAIPWNLYKSPYKLYFFHKYVILSR